MNDVVRSRRAVLGGALAVGCGVWVPIAISGCDSKKGATSTSTPMAAAPAASAASSGPATAKVAKTSVQYQTMPKGEQKCGTCQHFIAGSNTCKLVDGPISPEGWCSLWAAKA
jgi:hypothetical protein